MRLTNIARSQEKLASSFTYNKDLQKPFVKESVVLQDYHESLKHHPDQLVVPHRVGFFIFPKKNENFNVE